MCFINKPATSFLLCVVSCFNSSLASQTKTKEQAQEGPWLGSLSGNKLTEISLNVWFPWTEKEIGPISLNSLLVGKLLQLMVVKQWPVGFSTCKGSSQQWEPTPVFGGKVFIVHPGPSRQLWKPCCCPHSCWLLVWGMGDQSCYCLKRETDRNHLASPSHSPLDAASVVLDPGFPTA